jgi:hypothetical protein
VQIGDASYQQRSGGVDSLTMRSVSQKNKLIGAGASSITHFTDGAQKNGEKEEGGED